MPTVLRVRGWRLYFYSHDLGEPPHVHVDRGGASAKFWLAPVQRARNYGFRPRELRAIERLIRARQAEILSAWNEYFDAQSR